MSGINEGFKPKTVTMEAQKETIQGTRGKYRRWNATKGSSLQHP